MEASFRAVVLGVKHMNHFILREYDTLEANRYQKLEKVLQRSYGNRSANLKDKFRIDSFVVANVTLGSDRGPKLWLRGIVRQNYHQKNFLYGIHFPDYGFDKTCHKSDLRELQSYHYPEYVPFQEFNFFLTDVDHKPDVNREVVLEEIRNQFETKNFVIFVIVEGKDRKRSIYGSILLEDNCDLAAILLEKELVNDAHYCGRYSHKKNATQTDDNSGQEVAGPLPPGPFRSGIKASRVNYSLQLICKCDAVLKYKRKQLCDKLKLKPNNKKSSDQTSEHFLTNTV